MILNIILFILVGIFISYIALLKKEIVKISKQLKDIANNKTEKNIDVSLINKELTELAAMINENISFQKQLRIDVFKKEKKLKQSIANISHDLRTPLTSIMGYLQLLQKEKSTDVQKDYINVTLQKSEHLKKLIDQFFELSFYEYYEEVILEKINLNNFITDFIIENVETFENANITPTINMLSQPCYIFANEIMLKRIFHNLLSNAINYGTGNFIVTLSGDKVLCLSIENSINTPCEIDVNQLFDRFYLADNSRNTKGTGLGLAIVKTLIEKMDGKIMAEIIDGRFIINLFFRNDLYIDAINISRRSFHDRYFNS